MSRTLTLELPDDIAVLAQSVADAAQRPLEIAAVEWITERVGDAAPELPVLDALDDGALWHAARSRLGDELSRRSEALHHKRQLEGLTPAESEEVARLVRQAERVMLLRARAAELLHRRGHDISGLLAP